MLEAGNMKMWAVGEGSNELIMEEVDAGAVHGELFLEFHCPSCDELHSVRCSCAAKAEMARDFFCACVPDDCPSCRQPLDPDAASFLIESAV